MPLLDAVHDFAHPVEDDTAWSESYYFNAYDPVTDTGVFTRIAIRPNEGTMDVGLSVWLPENDLAVVGSIRPQQGMTDRNLDVGGIRYERIVPMREWRLTANAGVTIRNLTGQREPRQGRVALDLVFHALTPAVGSDGQGRAGAGASAETRRHVGKGHLEQAGRWSGWIAADERRWALADARGNRDKSWGPRRWGGPRMWRWFSINLGDDMHLGGIRIGTEAGDLHRGWVWRDGEAASIRRWDLETVLADDGLTHRTVHLRATDARGRTHALRGDVLRVAPVAHELGGHRTVINEGLARWAGEGHEGYGIAEYLHQLDPEGRPRVPIE
jgi:hypothetical protein